MLLWCIFPGARTTISTLLLLLSHSFSTSLFHYFLYDLKVLSRLPFHSLPFHPVQMSLCPPASFTFIPHSLTSTSDHLFILVVGIWAWRDVKLHLHCYHSDGSCVYCLYFLFSTSATKSHQEAQRWCYISVLMGEFDKEGSANHPPRRQMPLLPLQVESFSVFCADTLKCSRLPQ